MSGSSTLEQRHEFVLYFDVSFGNPNGDPDTDNMPRMDPETGHGLVSDVSLKRKVRNYVELVKADAPRFRIYVTEGAVLNERHREAYVAVRGDEESRTARKLTTRSAMEADAVRRFMCENFYDIRTFGAVLSTGINAGQVRGPVQIGFATSVEPIMPLEVSITRAAATNATERRDVPHEEPVDSRRGDLQTMGRKHVVPYGLYRAHGYVSAPLASHPLKGTGFDEADLALLFEALWGMFEHDRSAARGAMATRKLVVFRHASALGSAHAHSLFSRVTHKRVGPNGPMQPDEEALMAMPPARRFEDFIICVDRADLPTGVEILEDDDIFAPSHRRGEVVSRG